MVAGCTQVVDAEHFLQTTTARTTDGEEEEAGGGGGGGGGCASNQSTHPATLRIHRVCFESLPQPLCPFPPLNKLYSGQAGFCCAAVGAPHCWSNDNVPVSLLRQASQTHDRAHVSTCALELSLPPCHGR